jgi:hypothetical protein
MIVVVRSLDVDVDSVGGGGGAVAAGECICPAKTEPASAIVRIATAHVWRKFLTLCAS